MGKKIRDIEVSDDIFAIFVKAARKNIDIYEYIKKYKRDIAKLNQIYEGLEEGLDVSIFDDTSFTAAAMNLIRYGLKKDLDMSFLKTGMNEGVIRTVIELRENGINIENYINETTTEQEVRFLGERLFYKEPIDIYYVDKDITKAHYKIDKLKMIRKMFKNGFNLDEVDIDNLSESQLREVFKGFLTNVDYSLYNKKDYDYKLMREIRENLEYGIETLPDRLKSDTDNDYINKIKEQRLNLINDFDYISFNLKFYLGDDYEDKYDEDKVNILKDAINKNLDINILTRENYSAEQMEEIVFGLEDNLDVSSFIDVNLSDIEMNKIRNNMLKEREDNILIDDFLKKTFKKSKAIRTLIKNYRKVKDDISDGIELTNNILTIDLKNKEFVCIAIKKDSSEIPVCSTNINDTENFVKDITSILMDIKDSSDEEFEEIIEAIKKEEG